MGNVENCETFNTRSKLQYNAVTSNSSIKKEVLERGKYFYFRQSIWKKELILPIMTSDEIVMFS